MKTILLLTVALLSPKGDNSITSEKIIFDNKNSCESYGLMVGFHYTKLNLENTAFRLKHRDTFSTEQRYEVSYLCTKE